MLARRLIAAACLAAFANMAFAQPTLLADGIYLVLEAEQKNTFWARYFDRDDRELLQTPRLMNLDVASAEAELDKNRGAPVIQIVLTPSAREAFGRLSEIHVGRRLAIVLDGRVMTAPAIMEPIHGGELQISGAFSLEEAVELARRLRE